MNIFIVGPMGSGKSTVGKIISSELFLNFFDTDGEIETRTGASIDWIFDLEGEDGFRKRETKVLEEMVKQNSIVLSTGGGIILSETNRELLSPCLLLALLALSHAAPAALRDRTPARVRDCSMSPSGPLLESG